jgi:hypothetical protein
MMSQVTFEEDVAERNRLNAELNKDGREESTGVLLFGILEIEEEISHMRRRFVGGSFNILDNRRASGGRQNENLQPK